MSRRRPTGRPDPQAGRISVFLAVALTGLLLVFGAAVDISGQLRTLMRAQSVASEAARAAGQAIDGPQAMTGASTSVDAGLAAQYADEYLDLALQEFGQGYQREPIELVDGGAALQVTVTLVYEPQILSLFGVSEIPVTASATANLVTG